MKAVRQGQRVQLAVRTNALTCHQVQLVQRQHLHSAEGLRASVSVHLLFESMFHFVCSTPRTRA